MKITNQQEEDLIQEVLPKMLEQPGHPFPLVDTVPEQYLVVLLNRLTTEGLVTAANPKERDYLVRLTTKGVAVARHTGGYKGYLQAEQQNQIARDTREQKLAQATLDGVRANWWAVRVSMGGVLIGAIFSALSLLQSNTTAKELDAAQVQIAQLQQQLKTMAQLPPAATSVQPASAVVQPAATPPAARPAPDSDDD